MQNEKRVRLSLMVYESGIHSYIIRNKKKKSTGIVLNKIHSHHAVPHWMSSILDILCV